MLRRGRDELTNGDFSDGLTGWSMCGTNPSIRQQGIGDSRAVSLPLVYGYHLLSLFFNQPTVAQCYSLKARHLATVKLNTLFRDGREHQECSTHLAIGTARLLAILLSAP
ncbi:MAG: hypothetical protein AB8B63_24060 [Granulosicoccus sp.]